jgi:hypothetical protein
LLSLLVIKGFQNHLIFEFLDNIIFLFGEISPMKNTAGAKAIEVLEAPLIIVRRPCSVVTELLKVQTPFQFPSAPAAVAAAMRFSSIALNHEQLPSSSLRSLH